MKIERKLLSKCSLEDLKRIQPKNVRCNDENGNTDCEIFRTHTCPYFPKSSDEIECAYVDLLQARTPSAGKFRYLYPGYHLSKCRLISKDPMDQPLNGKAVISCDIEKGEKLTVEYVDDDTYGDIRHYYKDDDGEEDFREYYTNEDPESGCEILGKPCLSFREFGLYATRGKGIKSVYQYFLENVSVLDNPLEPNKPLELGSFYEDSSCLIPVKRAPESYRYAYRKVICEEGARVTADGVHNRDGYFFKSERVILFSIRPVHALHIETGAKTREIRRTRIKEGVRYEEAY